MCNEEAHTFLKVKKKERKKTEKNRNQFNKKKPKIKSNEK